jgi:hypothetical protein
MTEPPSPTRDPDAAGGNPAGDPHAPQPGFSPPRQQPPDPGQVSPPSGAGYFQGTPQGGYPPPGYSGPPAPPPPGYPTTDDRTWALIAHFGGAAGVFIGGLFGWVAPLVTLLTRGNQSPTVRAHAVAALNFQLTWMIVALVGYITLCLRFGEFIVAVAWLVGVITGIVAGVRANEGRLFNYPVSIPMVK